MQADLVLPVHMGGVMHKCRQGYSVHLNVGGDISKLVKHLGFWAASLVHV